MKQLYRSYTARQLNALYSARLAVPEHPHIFQRWRERSEACRRSAHALLDIPYGSSPRQSIDLFLPSVRKPPLLIFYHGGYWQSMARSDFSFLAREFVASGIAVAIPGYDLCPSVKLDDILQQAQQVVRWAVSNSDEYGLDGNRIHLAGHSAGAQLVTMLLAADWGSDMAGEICNRIHSALSISGVFDLEPLIYTPINDALKLDLQAARRNSPLFHAPHCRAPLLLAVGANESIEFHRQSQEMAAVWSDSGVESRYLMLEDCNHFTAVEQLAHSDTLLFKSILETVKGST